MRKVNKTLTVLILLLVVASTALAQPFNFLLFNSWQSKGNAKIEKIEERTCFTVRNGGSFQQEVTLPGDATGKFLVFFGQGASERIHADKSITDLPYLYGFIVDSGIRQQERILSYLQGMSGRPTRANEWVTMSGIFKIPENASKVRLFLNQASAKGVEHDGSAARFYDVGMYIFPTEEGARFFVEEIHGKK